MRRFILVIALAAGPVMFASGQPPIAPPDARGLPRRDVMRKGGVLTPGQWLKTSNGSGDLYGVVLQSDGNFVLYDTVDSDKLNPGHAKWSSWGEWGSEKKVKKIVFSDGGDLLGLGEPVDGKDVILWSSYTNKDCNRDGRSGNAVCVVDDKLRIYSADNFEMWRLPK